MTTVTLDQLVKGPCVIGKIKLFLEYKASALDTFYNFYICKKRKKAFVSQFFRPPLHCILNTLNHHRFTEYKEKENVVS